MKSSFNLCPQHESFEELAALAAVGDLSPLELERLRRHLADCRPCREAYEIFADMASNDLGAVAAVREAIAHVGLGDANETEAQEHLGRFRSRMNADASAQGPSAIVHQGNAGNNRPARAWVSRRVGYSIAATLQSE